MSAPNSITRNNWNIQFAKHLVSKSKISFQEAMALAGKATDSYAEGEAAQVAAENEIADWNDA